MQLAKPLHVQVALELLTGFEAQVDAIPFAIALGVSELQLKTFFQWKITECEQRLFKGLFLVGDISLAEVCNRLVKVNDGILGSELSVIVEQWAREHEINLTEPIRSYLSDLSGFLMGLRIVRKNLDDILLSLGISINDILIIFHDVNHQESCEEKFKEIIRSTLILTISSLIGACKQCKSLRASRLLEAFATKQNLNFSVALNHNERESLISNLIIFQSVFTMWREFKFYIDGEGVAPKVSSNLLRKKELEQVLLFVSQNRALSRLHIITALNEIGCMHLAWKLCRKMKVDYSKVRMPSRALNQFLRDFPLLSQRVCSTQNLRSQLSLREMFWLLTRVADKKTVDALIGSSTAITPCLRHRNQDIANQLFVAVCQKKVNSADVLQLVIFDLNRKRGVPLPLSAIKSAEPSTRLRVNDIMPLASDISGVIQAMWLLDLSYCDFCKGRMKNVTAFNGWLHIMDYRPMLESGHLQQLLCCAGELKLPTVQSQSNQLPSHYLAYVEPRMIMLKLLVYNPKLVKFLFADLNIASYLATKAEFSSGGKKLKQYELILITAGHNRDIFNQLKLTVKMILQVLPHSEVKDLKIKRDHTKNYNELLAEIDIPQQFVCPISRSVLMSPIRIYTDKEMFTYFSRRPMLMWLANNATHPYTRKKLDIDTIKCLPVDVKFEQKIEQWIDELAEKALPCSET
ncbi:MAG: hypothetical protein ACPGUD_03785 [Parashewanella sp.]